MKNKYADTALSFNSYYKYEFFYEGIAKDGKKILVSNYGGSDDIYRADLRSNMTLQELCYELPVSYIQVGDKAYEIEL